MSAAMPTGHPHADETPNGQQSSAQFSQLMAANGLMFKAAHITIKGALTTSANTAVNTAKNSPKIMHSKSKSIQSGGGNKSHSSMGPAQSNNYVQQKSAQGSERHRDANNKSNTSGHATKSQLSNQINKPKN